MAELIARGAEAPTNLTIKLGNFDIDALSLVVNHV